MIQQIYDMGYEDGSISKPTPKEKELLIKGLYLALAMLAVFFPIALWLSI